MLNEYAQIAHQKFLAREREKLRADKRLRDAAPDLLAALREIDTIVNESASECRKRMGTRLGNIMVTVRAAIAKAEGVA